MNGKSIVTRIKNPLNRAAHMSSFPRNILKTHIFFQEPDHMRRTFPTQIKPDVIHGILNV